MTSISKRVLFCTPTVSPFFNLDGKRVGGAEKQVFGLISALSKKFKFYLLLYGKKPIEHEEISISSSYSFGNNFFAFTLIQKFLYTWSTFFLIRKEKIDIVYNRGINNLFNISLCCKILDTKCIFHVASDHHLSKLRANFFSLNYKSQIKDMLVICQNDKQHNMCLDNNVTAFKVSNFVQFRQKDQAMKFNNPTVIWIGNIKSKKQPMLMLELAKLLPDLKFLVLGGKVEESLYKQFIRVSKKLKNLKYLGFCKRDFTEKILQKSHFLINTSLGSKEGFPNVFLEAWSFGVPVISLECNPDNLFDNYDLGIVSNSIHKMAEDIRNILEDKIQYEMFSKSSSAYVRSHHDLESISGSISNILEDF